MALELKKFVALELFSGIGGFHHATRDASAEFEITICAAVDINTAANETYRFNFPNTNLMQRNIESFTVKELNELSVDLIWMSPPCQPFTRVGKRRDCQDVRTAPFLHLLTLLSQLKKKPSYILLENVKGFETSDARAELLTVLRDSCYNFQEFLLTPSQFQLPNSRMRYYVVAKLQPLEFKFATTDEVMTSLPGSEDGCKEIIPISEVLEQKMTDEYVKQFLVPDKILLKFGKLLDIVDKDATNCCCFTKAYTHYSEGTGSVLHSNLEISVSDIFSEISELSKDDPRILSLLQSLKLRYFTPKEVATLLGLNSCDFPESITVRQKYRLLGNSLNALVVRTILRTCL